MPIRCLVRVKTTAYFRDVVRQKHPGIEMAWIQRVIAEPLEERRQADGRYALWGLVPEAQNRALRVITLEDRETVHKSLRKNHRRKHVFPRQKLISR